MCLFCDLYKERSMAIVMENDTCFAIMDKYPVNTGHMLIIPKDHKETFFDLSYKEHEDMIQLLKNCKAQLDSQVSPEGYNIGYNVGAWAGQTIFHCHAHLIPRYAGDVSATELKGGIRNFKKPLKEYTTNE